MIHLRVGQLVGFSPWDGAGLVTQEKVAGLSDYLGAWPTRSQIVEVATMVIRSICESKSKFKQTNVNNGSRKNKWNFRWENITPPFTLPRSSASEHGSSIQKY